MSVEGAGPEREVGRANFAAASGAVRRQIAPLVTALLTVAVALTYVTEPQTPRDFLDRLALLVDARAYGPNLRGGRLARSRAARARSAGSDSVAEGLEWEAARAYTRAAVSAPGSREELAANDGLADVYLALGHSYLARGRGGLLGMGRDEEELAVAESIGACVVGLAPARRRGELNAFLEELEGELERPVSGRCPI
jgi:hypothetical protein